MTAFANTQNPILASEEPAVSRGGLRIRTYYTIAVLGDYATGGFVPTVPTVPTNYDLLCLDVVAHNCGAGVDLMWDSANPTKILAYVEDGTSGISAEVANGVTTYAAKVVYLRWTYVAGLS